MRAMNHPRVDAMWARARGLGGACARGGGAGERSSHATPAPPVAPWDFAIVLCERLNLKPPSLPLAPRPPPLPSGLAHRHGRSVWRTLMRSPTQRRLRSSLRWPLTFGSVVVKNLVKKNPRVVPPHSPPPPSRPPGVAPQSSPDGGDQGSDISPTRPPVLV